jgi:hypothetical protein
MKTFLIALASTAGSGGRARVAASRGRWCSSRANAPTTALPPDTGLGANLQVRND